jgi:PAS domain S-box-containing protein
MKRDFKALTFSNIVWILNIGCMKISLDKKIIIGFVFNLLVVFASGLLFFYRHYQQPSRAIEVMLNWVEPILFVLSIVLLIIVFIIIRAQLRAKNLSIDALLENKQLLQSIIDNTSNPIFIKKINGEYLLINKQFETLFKITNQEILGKSDYDFMPKTVADAYANSDFEVLKALRELKSEETIEQSDGMHTYIAVKFPLYDTKGRIYAICGIFTDITERKKTEHSLLAADKFFNMSVDILAIVSKDTFIKINPATLATLGYSEQELLMHKFYDYMLPEDHEISRKEVEKLQKGILTLNFENRYICKNGQIKTIIWSVFPELSTGLLYAVGRDITEHKEAEKALMAAENFFNISFDMFVIIREDKFIKVNPAFYRILGYDSSEILNESYQEFTHPDDVAVFRDIIIKLQLNDSVISHRIRNRCKNGDYKWLDWTSTIDLHTGIIYAVAKDVSELIQVENSLKTANLFFDLAFDILMVADEEHFIKINPTFSKTLGYNQEDMNRIKFIDIIHPEDKKRTQEIIKKHLEGEPIMNFRARFVCKDGSYKWLDLNSNIDLSWRIFYSVGRDVTKIVELENEQKRVLNELYENEEKLRLVVENISEGIIVTNANRNVILANDMANEIFGIEDDALITTDFSAFFEIYYPDGVTVFPSQNLPIERALKGEITDDLEVVLVGLENNIKRRVLISGKPLVDQNGKVVAVVITIKDISKYKQMEEDLKESELKYRQLIGFTKSDGKLK